MNSARTLSIADFNYELPDERIARYPLTKRGDAKQLRYRDGVIESGVFSDLPACLPEGTLLIGNRTRVIHARLFFPHRSDERPIEIFCLDPLEPADYAQSLGSVDPVRWKCLIGGNRRWKSGELTLQHAGITLRADRIERIENAFVIAFSWESTESISFGEVIESMGNIPLPPYLKRNAEASDRERYQTVFAREAGSVAAPTAGLHFTPAIIERLKNKAIDWEEVTLHVGAGTFKPVSSDTLDGHLMHREFFTVSRSLLRRLADQLREGKPIVSVGTTSMRCLESLFYCGATLLKTGKLVNHLPQWVTEDRNLTEVPQAVALLALANELAATKRETFNAYTQLLLTPASEVKMVDALVTNFHQPRSTLLLLVAAMVGEDWKKIYDYALTNDYRFLSYGDSSLLWRATPAAK